MIIRILSGLLDVEQVLRKHWIFEKFYKGVRKAPGVKYLHAGEVDELVELRN